MIRRPPRSTLFPSRRSSDLDTIWTAVNYALTNTSEVENLFYGGAGNFTGSGNDLDNRIAGLTGDDILSGGEHNAELHSLAWTVLRLLGEKEEKIGGGGRHHP